MELKQIDGIDGVKTLILKRSDLNHGGRNIMKFNGTVCAHMEQNGIDGNKQIKGIKNGK